MTDLSGDAIARELREIAGSLARAAAGLSRLADRLDATRPGSPDHPVSAAPAGPRSGADPGDRSAASRARERTKDDAHEKR